MVEDVNRNDTGKTSQTVGDRLRKAYDTYTQALMQLKQQDHERGTIELLAKAIGVAMASLQKEQPTIVVNVPEQPRPVVNVAVRTPKVKNSRQIVHRDSRQNITHTETVNEYDEE